MLGALGCHFLGCSSEKRPFIHWGPATKLCFSLVILALLTHYWNPHQKNPNWNTEIDGILKVSLVVILLEAQMNSVYKAAAILGSLAAGTLWWVKGGMRLAFYLKNLTLNTKMVAKESLYWGSKYNSRDYFVADIETQARDKHAHARTHTHTHARTRARTHTRTHTKNNRRRCIVCSSRRSSTMGNLLSSSSF